MSKAISFLNPTLPSSEAIERYLAVSRAERWFTNFGPCWQLLRDRLAEAAGRPCIPVANGTLGLMVAVAALKQGEGDALMPSFAFAPSAQAAVWNRLDPVFLDVSQDHWHLDPAGLEAALSARPNRVSVVIALSAFGVPPTPDVRVSWEELCTAAGVPLIVDSAAGYGAQAADAVPVGAQGDAEIVSFDALKPLPAGEGGAVFCRDAAVAEEILALTNFGLDETRRVSRSDGLNAKLSDPAAAIALASLDDLPQMLEARRAIAESIVSQLPPGFVTQQGSELGTWQFVPVLAPDSAVRADVLEKARLGQIEVRTYYDPLHLEPAFAECERADDLAVTEDLHGRMLNLPIAVDLEASRVEAIVEMVQAGASAWTTADR